VLHAVPAVRCMLSDAWCLLQVHAMHHATRCQCLHFIILSGTLHMLLRST